MSAELQLFTDFGQPEAGAERGVRRKQDCRMPGCHEPVVRGKGRSYCGTHECNYDTCACMAIDAGRCKRHAPCKVEGCTNTRRPVSAAKYCEEHATSIDYELRQQVPADAQGDCLVCGCPVKQRRAIGSAQSMFICRDHRHLREVLKMWRYRYHLPDDKIRRLIATAECWVCGGDLRWRFASRDRVKLETVHVDHDHRCCPGEASCGRCVRGLAHAACNRHIGHIESVMKQVGVASVHRLVDRLDEWNAEGSCAPDA